MYCCDVRGLEFTMIDMPADGKYPSSQEGVPRLPFQVKRRKAGTVGCMILLICARSMLGRLTTFSW